MADVETTAALDNIAKLVLDSSAASSRRSADLYTKMDANHATAQESTRLLGLEVAKVTTAFGAHSDQDEKDFKDVRKRLDSQDARWWKLVGGSILGAGGISGFIQMITGKGGS